MDHVQNGPILALHTFVPMEVSSLLPLAASVLLGICLAAACGFRVFLPLFIASLLSYLHIGGVDLRWGFEWMSTLPAANPPMNPAVPPARNKVETNNERILLCRVEKALCAAKVPGKI